MEHEKAIVESNRNAILKLLNTSKGEAFDICAAAFHIICSSESQETTFRYFLEEGINAKSDESVEVDAYFTSSSIQKLKDNCEDLVDGILNKLVRANLGESEFYRKLWLLIQNNDIFSTIDEKIYALYSVYSDCRIPYFKLDVGMEMSDEEFANISKSIQDDIKKAIYIFNLGLEQKTEVAYHLMNLLNSYKSIREQSVLLIHILKIAEQSTDLYRVMIEKILSKQ